MVFYSFENVGSRLLLPVHSRNGKLYPLGDVCGVVADAFKVFGYHQNVYSIFSGIWVLVDYADDADVPGVFILSSFIFEDKFFILTKKLFISFIFKNTPSRPSAGVCVTTGCIAAGSTRCRLRTFVM